MSKKRSDEPTPTNGAAKGKEKKPARAAANGQPNEQPHPYMRKDPDAFEANGEVSPHFLSTAMSGAALVCQSLVLPFPS